MDDLTLQAIRERDEAWVGASLTDMPEIARERRVLLAEVDRLREMYNAVATERNNLAANFATLALVASRLRDGITRHASHWDFKPLTDVDRDLWALIGDDDD